MITTTGTLHPVPPFDFIHTLRFIAGFKPMQSLHRVVGEALFSPLSVNGQAVVAEVRSVGTIDNPELAYTFHSDAPLTNDMRAAAEDRLAFWLSLNDDLRPFYVVAQADEAFATIMQSLYGYHQVKFTTPFEAACWGLISQRNHMAVSRKMLLALAHTFGSRLMVDDVLYTAFPEPAALIPHSVERINDAVGNTRKSETLLGAAFAFEMQDEDWLRHAPYDEVNRWLRAIKGVGEWTANFILLRGLGRMDIAPMMEKFIATSASKVYGETVTERDFARLAAPYGTYAGYWAHYMRVGA